MRLRGVDDPDLEQRDLLNGNIAQAEAAYRTSPDFETAARALSGWREAINQRLDADRAAEWVLVPAAMIVTLDDGRPVRQDAGEAAPRTRVKADAYFRGVPARFRDVERFVVERVIKLTFTDQLPEDLKVRDRGAVVWVARRHRSARPSRYSSNATGWRIGMGAPSFASR